MLSIRQAECGHSKQACRPGDQYIDRYSLPYRREEDGSRYCPQTQASQQPPVTHGTQTELLLRDKREESPESGPAQDKTANPHEDSVEGWCITHVAHAGTHGTQHMLG